MPVPRPDIPLPSTWPEHARSAVLFAVGLAHYALAIARGWCANSRLARVRLAADNDRLKTEVGLLREELRIKDARMAHIVDAGESGSSLDRPGLQHALGLLRCRRAGGLLVAKLDRLTRSVRDLGVLIEQHFDSGCALLSVAEQIDTRTAGGRLVLNILASVSQWEREAIGERTSQSMQHMRRVGLYTGGRARYGFAPDHQGSLEAVSVEQHAIEQARELRERGMSYRAISQVLATIGIMSRAGRPFVPGQVRRMTMAA